MNALKRLFYKTVGRNEVKRELAWETLLAEFQHCSESYFLKKVVLRKLLREA